LNQAQQRFISRRLTGQPTVSPTGHELNALLDGYVFQRGHQELTILRVGEGAQKTKNIGIFM
jgi:hypothetical protein